MRALETRTVRRLGGKKEITVDIRIVAATNKDLQKAIADGELREDLYYRLAVVELFLPPLRERAGDIPLLAKEFLQRFGQQNGKNISDFDDAAMDWVLAYHWPGNVRELKNAVERAVIMARSDRVGAADIIPRHLRGSGEISTTLSIPVGSTAADARRQLVLRTFASTGGDMVRASRILGLAESEVRAEILALMNRNGTSDTTSGPAKSDTKPGARPAAASTKVKKHR
ncbi:MAG: hypothetical protein PVSMB1_11710 [Gemmatimonadaceae bacterium]